MSTHTTHTTLVLGATGKTGRRVAERLRARGVDVREGSRNGSPAFDWDDRSTWTAALHGATAAYVSYFPDLAVPGAAETTGAFAELAVAAGVRRLVLLSGRGEEEAQRAEERVLAAYPAATVVRCSWFAQNFSEGHFLEPVLAGEVALPVGDVGEPFVDVEDIADVAVAALTEDGHEGEVYELTGPRLLSFAGALAEISRAAGRPIELVPVTLDEYLDGMAQEGVPDDVAGLIAYLFGEVLDGRNASVCDGVQRALGREPRDFCDYAVRSAATGVWARREAAA
jgi:uncharacterized protein YbjT (DUF2867 family)